MILAPTPVRSERCLFASDLHLDGTTRREVGLRRLLAESARSGADLFLLGDVFHYWFGRKHLGLGMFRRELELLRRATDQGTRIWFVPGNRDFLVEEGFTARTGVAVAGDSLELSVGGERIHLSHGDLFSTSDVAYQRMRRLLRHKMLLFLAHQLPALVVRTVARRIRAYSSRVVREKPLEILEPDMNAVSDVMSRGYQTVVCGHFHECRDEAVTTSEGGGRFFVLEPFEEHGFVMTRDDQGWSSRRLEEKESV